MNAKTRLGRYELLARIATGGMGEIFLARLEGAAGFEKLCVIKRILPHLADDDRFRSMLIAEARIASNMSHANICHVYELDETDRQLYLVMEYLHGVTLLQVLRARLPGGALLDLGFIAGVIQQACEGLDYAHELRDRAGTSLGVVHRDVTPSNLFVTESGVVKVVDFGIAKGEGTAETQPGVVKGKYAYMAPEQLRGQLVDRRADVFSLGVVVYELVTRRRLYQRKTDYLTLRAVMAPPELELRTRRPDAPEALGPVLMRALAGEPSVRYSTVRELGAALLEALAVRPWGQAEISALVRSTFADHLRLTNEEITRVIKRAGQSSSRTIPVILASAGGSGGDDAVSAVESVAESGVSAGGPRETGNIRTAGAGHARFGPQPSQPIAIAQPPRRALPLARHRRLAPVFAIAGSAALVLVVGLALIGPPAPSRAAATIAPAAQAGEPARAGRPRRGATEPYSAAIRAREHELDRCAREHTEPLPAAARAVVVVGVDGHARRIALEPEPSARTALGGCIRGVLAAVAFPAAPAETELAVSLAIVR